MKSMKNFASSECDMAIENGSVTSLKCKDFKLPERSLVLVKTSKSGRQTAYVLVAKCRNTDKRSIIKCLAKAVLAEEVELQRENNTTAVTISGNKQRSILRQALGAQKICVTNGKGEVIPDSVLEVGDKTTTGTLSPIFKFDKNLVGGLYSLIVDAKLPWDNVRVVNALNWWVAAACQHLDYMKKLDKALGKAADSTEKEEDAKEKADKEKAAKEAKAAKVA